MDEKPKVGAATLLGLDGFAPMLVVGGIVSIFTVWVPTAVMLPTLSSASHSIVVVPSAETLNVALEPATAVPLVTTSLPLIAGAEPSVV